VELVRLLKPGMRVALTTHVNADGDGAGSEVALWHLLTARGVRAVIANPTPFPERYAFLLYGVLALGLGLYYIFLVLRLKRRQKVKKDPPRRIIL